MSARTPAGALRVVAIAQLRTSYARLRPGCPRRCLIREPAALPIRVVPSADGGFEVLDGFKRLRASQEQGVRELPVVIEPPSQPPEHKRLLLAANAPPRTLTALDEARVVCSLIDDDQLSVAAVARQLGKRRHWVERRYAIGRRLGYSRKIVRRVLNEANLSPTSVPPHPSPPSKLTPFQALIDQKVRQGLTTSRILREIRDTGYQGGRTILADQVRQLRATVGRLPHKTVKRRFETAAGVEMQVDWSPYLLPVGSRTQKVHVLGCLLCHSRKLFVHCFADERQPTLLEGLAMAFEYFEGAAHRVVLDNMATAVLGRYQPNTEILWHPRFADFARHYGFKPFACKPRDPNRKGKKEKSFRLLWDDFLKGSHFTSFEDLNARARLWLDDTPDTANCRVHATTRQVPNEGWSAERALLIALPENRFAVYEQRVRLVDADSTISVRGTRYSVPSSLANHSVEVRLFAEHFEVLDSHGRLAWSRRYVGEADHGKLIIDPTHYATLKRQAAHARTERLDHAFLARYPSLAALVRGLTLKMKSLAGVHLRALLRLAERYGSEALLAAAEHAQLYRRYDARAVERILQQRHGPGDDPDLAPLTGHGPDLVNEVEGGTLDAYFHLDDAPAHSPDSPSETPAATPHDGRNEAIAPHRERQEQPGARSDANPDTDSTEE